MAVANLVSRITGFLRQIVLVGVLGVGVLNDAYTVSNTLPNIVYELLFGGVLTSVDGPAARAGPEGGRRRRRDLHPAPDHAHRRRAPVRHRARGARRPLLTRLYLGGQSATANPELATALAYLLLPQILFYGLGALLGAILNTRGSFGAFAVGARAQQRRRARRPRGLRADAGGDQPRPGAHGRAEAAGAGHRHHARHRRAGARAPARPAPHRLRLPPALGMGPAPLRRGRARSPG